MYSLKQFTHYCFKLYRTKDQTEAKKLLKRLLLCYNVFINTGNKKA